MKGTKAFPEGFGDDTALMFAGSTGSRLTGGAASASPASVESAPTPDEPPTEGPTGPDAIVDGYEQAWATPTVKLGRRGFHFPPPQAEADDSADGTSRQPPSVLIPVAIVGLILAVATYFFNFIN